MDSTVTQPHQPGVPPPSDEVEGSILSTLNQDGSRKWLRPRVSPGRFLSARRVVAYVLILLFTALPYIKINGYPAILLDLIGRRFHIFGTTFYPTDTLPFALLMLSVFVAIFLLTALLGRVWCGWACPQTVYMEFLYRPIERLFEGSPGKRKKHGGWRKPVKHVVYLLCSMYLAHTFLAYFVGVDQLRIWITEPPFEHPRAFVVMIVMTGLMMFDFSFFREQVCLVACPYGRFQSVMLDRFSMIVTYDSKRGEPRGRKLRQSKDVSLPLADSQPEKGDCIDCKLCVTTCPTGIDIRSGLQMECIGCAQCIDACDVVMDKIGRSRGLIRYSSQARIEDGQTRLIRPRVLFYPAFLLVLLGGLFYTLATRATADVWLLRGAGMGAAFATLETGNIANQVRVKIVNRTDAAVSYQITLKRLNEAQIVAPAGNPVTVGAGEVVTDAIQIVVPPELFSSRGRRPIVVHVDDGLTYSRDFDFLLLGPAGSWKESPSEVTRVSPAKEGSL